MDNEMTQNPGEEQNKEMQRGNTHIYAYTALIFIVAILMILLAFFGQANVENEKHINTEGKSITERSSALSNENLSLRDRVDDLTEDVEEKEGELNVEREINAEHAKIFSVQILVDLQNFAEAKNVIDTIDQTKLSGDALLVYNKLNETITAATKSE